MFALYSLPVSKLLLISGRLILHGLTRPVSCVAAQIPQVSVDRASSFVRHHSRLTNRILSMFVLYSLPCLHSLGRNTSLVAEWAVITPTAAGRLIADKYTCAGRHARSTPRAHCLPSTTDIQHYRETSS